MQEIMAHKVCHMLILYCIVTVFFILRVGTNIVKWANISNLIGSWGTNLIAADCFGFWVAT